MKTKTGGKSADFGNDTINYSGTDETQDLKSMLRRIESRLDLFGNEIFAFET